MATTDDYPSRRTGAGLIGGQDLPYKNLDRMSFGKIGDQPIPNANFGSLAETTPVGAAAPGSLSLAALLDKPAALSRDIGASVLGTLAKPAAHITDGVKNAAADAVGHDRPNRFADIEAANGLAKSGADALDSGPFPTLASMVGAAGWTPKGAKPAAPAAAGATTPTPTPTPGAQVAPVVSAAEKPAARALPDGFTLGQSSAPGVTRINGGSSPLFTNIDPAAAVGEMQGNPIGIIPKGASPFGSSGGSSDLSAALQAAATRGDWAAIRNHYQKNGGTFNGETAGGDARGKLLEALTTIAPGRDNLSAKQAGLLANFLNTERQTDTQAEHHRLQSLLTGSQLSSAQQLQALQKQYMDEADPVKQAEIGRKLLMMQGKDPRQPHDEALKARSTLVGDLAKAYSSSPIPPLGPDGKTPLTMEQYIQQGLAQAAGTPAAGNQGPTQTSRAVAVGQVVGGYKFKGGDPNKATSWEAAQ